jgi:hypothetical protein
VEVGAETLGLYFHLWKRRTVMMKLARRIEIVGWSLLIIATMIGVGWMLYATGNAMFRGPPSGGFPLLVLKSNALSTGSVLVEGYLNKVRKRKVFHRTTAGEESRVTWTLHKSWLCAVITPCGSRDFWFYIQAVPANLS